MDAMSNLAALMALLMLIISNFPATAGAESTTTTTATVSCDFGATTKLHSKQQLLLSRKKRYIFWTPGSAVLATMSFAKALATKYPRGVNFVAEADFFYPLPTKITDWYPTTKKPPVASAPKVDADAAVLQYVPLLEAPQPSGPYSLQPNDYWHRSSIYTQTPAVLTAPSSSSTADVTTRLRPSSAYGPLAAAASGTRHRTASPVWYVSRPPPFASDRYYNNRRPSEQQQQQVSYSYSDWRHRRGHRERRDLYTKFETMASEHGLDIRGCLLRMICEAKHYLLPHGKSFFHDVLRILFYVPEHRASTKDAYADAMRSTADDCTTEYRRQCRYSILGLLLSREKHTFG